MKKNLLKILSTLLISCNLFAVPASANTWHKLISYNGDSITWYMYDDNGEGINGWYQENGEWYYFDYGTAGPDTIESNKDRRIPQGEYRLSRWVSKKYPQSLLVHNEVVPKERAILIHNGNTPNHTLGCILLGYTTDNKSGVYNSRKCIADLMKYVVEDEEMEDGIIN